MASNSRLFYKRSNMNQDRVVKYSNIVNINRHENLNTLHRSKRQKQNTGIGKNRERKTLVRRIVCQGIYHTNCGDAILVSFQCNNIVALRSRHVLIAYELE